MSPDPLCGELPAEDGFEWCCESRGAPQLAPAHLPPLPWGFRLTHNMGGPNAGEFMLVGVPADQLLNRYTRQRGTDIGVLSDDLLTIVLFAVGDIKTSGDVRAPRWRALPHVLACRQVCSRWRVLSARPVLAAALWDFKSSGLNYLAQFTSYIAPRLKHKAEHVGGSRDATFLVTLYENGLTGGLRAAPADVACMRAVALYFDHLFEQGLSRPGLIVCTPSQMSMWCRAFQGDHPDGRRLHCVPSFYAGDEESRMSLLRASPRCTIFIAAFSTITQEQMWEQASDNEGVGSDSESEERTEKPNVLKRSCAYVVDSRVATTGILLGRNLYSCLPEAVIFGTPTCVQLRPLSSTTSFSDGVDAVRSLSQTQTARHKNGIPVEANWLEAADRFSFGDQDIARWGIEDYAGQLLKKMADVFFRIAQG